MSEKLSRREWLAASLSLPAIAGESSRWNDPVPLGRSGVKVTRLAMTPGQHGAGLIPRALDLGINYFNAFALYYDESDFPSVRATLKTVRHRIVLGAGSGQTTKQGLLTEIDKKLHILGTDHIDLWYLAALESVSDETLEAMNLAKESGKIRACVISTHKFATMARQVLEARDTVDALMVACNFATWDGGTWAAARADIARIREAGIGIVGMKAMLGGLKFVMDDRRAWADSLTTEAKRQAALAAALRWILRNELVDTSPITMTSLEQLEGNVKAASAPFSDADEKVLAAELVRISPYYCRMCPRCQATCRSGLPVPDLMRFLLYADGYGKLPAARQAFRELPARIRDVRCQDCAGCTVRCPNGVQVRERVTRAQTVLA
ncbi:MAG TPA: aldo/keto reductase [Bryobacteraceae bacterium]|nr:aldo/keto reductase [Bryobacteraceae bacterium]